MNHHYRKPLGTGALVALLVAQGAAAIILSFVLSTITAAITTMIGG